MAPIPDRLRLSSLIRTSLGFGLIALSYTAAAQSQDNRARLVAQISGHDRESAASLRKILAWGSRPWEPAIAAPLIVEQRDPARNMDRSFYFALEAGDLGGQAPHLPCSTREETFARTVDRLLKSEGPAPWPVFVFSGSTNDKRSLDAFSLATTRRIFVRDGHAAPQPASAILLNSAYWGGNDPAPVWDNHLVEVAARHEMYHARRAWLRAEETAAHTDAIEARLREAHIAVQDRTRLESLVRQGIAAWEEVEAVDSSLVGVALPTYRRQRFLEYREQNKELQKKVVQVFAGLFTGVKDGKAKKELEHWLTELLRKDLQPQPRRF